MSETIAHELREEILTGRIRPGTRVHQVEVAKRFGVSTTPVREAFALLAQEGLLSSRAHRGAVVLGAIEQDVRESFDIRMALETFAVRRAVPNLTDDDLSVLRDLLSRYVNIGIVQPEEVQSLVAQFFDQIYAASGSKKLHKSIQDIRGATDVYLLLMATDRPALCTDRRPETIRLYQSIYLACAARDEDAAVAAVVDHLESTAEAVLGYLEAISAAEGNEVPTPA
jgi:DNA-binding GntR family transcriptional regulator